MRLFSVSTHLDYMILGYGAVIVLAGRQSDETVRVGIGVYRFLNVDILIVTFKFLPHLTVHEKRPLLIYRRF